MRIRCLILFCLLLGATACAPQRASLTPLAASTGDAPTRLAADGPPPTRTPTPTPTPVIPTASPTPSPSPTPPITRTPVPPGEDAEVPAPTALPPLPDTPGTDIFLIIGTDADGLNRATRADAIVLLALHREAGAATLLALPRDLYVFIPTRGMDRLNTAYPHGAQTGYPGGGAALLRDTIAYNVGIHAPVYARVDFGGFEALVDALGGVEVAVPCALQDWALRPGGDPASEDDWAMLTLPAGVHRLDGRLALWYVRSRRTSTDLDRGRRQQDVLRALGEAARARGWLETLPGVWGMLTGHVDTNLTLDRALGLAPAALGLRPDRIDRLLLQRGAHYDSWTAPGGAAVLRPHGEALAALAAEFARPPAENRLVLAGASVQVVNHSGQPDLARIAAERLAWEGLPATYDDSGGGSVLAETVISDFTGRAKDSPLAVLQAALGVPDAGVTVRPLPAREVDFRVDLGQDYDPCVYPILKPE